ncbi:MAG TPA: sulfite exporter TauE/SafE family protein [Cellvibrionaceae bacterium]|nr:sulfite exporter TauE/SafE family protein [Cellvibrionaceae bacterium]
MLLLIGLAIGLILGLTGAGGSVFAVPLLMLLAGTPMLEATGIALGAVAAASLFGSLRNRASGMILWVPGLLLAATGMLSAPIGKWLALQTPPQVLILSFNALAVLIALRMGYSAAVNPEQAQVVRASVHPPVAPGGALCPLSPSGQFQLRLPCVSGLLMGGALVGLLSGLLGVGGGFLIVPLLLALSPIGMPQAVSTSLVVITLVSSAGFISHLTLHQPLDWSLLGLITLGSLLGMALSQGLAKKIANARLQKLFAASLIAVALISSKTLIFP